MASRLSIFHVVGAFDFPAPEGGGHLYVKFFEYVKQVRGL